MRHISSSATSFKTHHSSGRPTCAPPDLKCKRARPRPAFSSWGAMSPILEPAGSPLTYSRCSLGGTESSSHSAAYGKSVCMRLMRPSFSCTCRLETSPDCCFTSGACVVQWCRHGVAHSKSKWQPPWHAYHAEEEHFSRAPVTSVKVSRLRVGST